MNTITSNFLSVKDYQVHYYYSSDNGPVDNCTCIQVTDSHRQKYNNGRRYLDLGILMLKF